MKQIEKCFIALCIFLLPFFSFGESNLATLLFGYLKNDLNLQKYTLTAESKLLEYDSTKIENGISLTLSTGTVKIQTSSDGTKYTFTPSASLEIPELHDTTVSVSLPMVSKTGYSIDSENGTFLDDGSVKVSTGIVTSAPLKRKVSLLEAERAYIEAERAVQDQALTVENEFYENLKSLYSYVTDVLEKKNDLYDDEVDLKVLAAQGYSKTSSSYRSKYLECQSDRRNVHEAERKLEREIALFAMKCGVEYDRAFDTTSLDLEKSEEAGDMALKNAMDFLPSEIPTVELEDVLSYERDDYTTIESAVWSQYISDLKRKTDYTLEVGAYAGYTFNESSSTYDTVDGGLTFDWRGISASAGVSIPTGNNVLPLESSSSGIASKSPVYTFAVSISPNTWRLASIDKKQDALNAQIDEIAVKSAADDYETDIVDKLTSRGDLAWSEKSYAEEYDMYSKLEFDMDAWLKQGIVTESDYLDAANNRDKARINMLITAVEKIIYNNEVKLLFVRDTAEKGAEHEN